MPTETEELTATMPAIEVLKPTEIVSDFDSKSSVTILGGSIWQILRHLELNLGGRHIDDRFVGSGRLRIKRKENTLRISVQVGCCCERDCCGHVCSLNYELQKMSGYWIVMRHVGFNY